MHDHDPPTSLDKPAPGDDHASIPARVLRLELIVEEVIQRLHSLESAIETQRKENREDFRRLEVKIDAKFDLLFRLIFGMMAMFSAGLLAILGRAFGIY